MNCKVCGRQIILRSEPGRARPSDGTFSIALDGWLCFGCQVEGLADAAEACDDETTLPNLDPEWPQL